LVSMEVYPMKTHRYWLPIVAAIAFVAAPAAALADVYVNGTGDLQPWDKNQCSYYGKGFRCNLGWGNSTLISFHNPKKKDGCGWKVVNQGTMFKGDRWHVELFNGGWATEKCTYHWTNDNTVNISEPK
jgi:hypothetical protein